jgi:DNA mismatch repair protein MLH1
MDLKTTGCLAAGKKKCSENESYLCENIGIVFGSNLKKELELVHIDFDDRLKFEMNAYMSNGNYTQLKQMIFILFINERLVDCQPIKKTLQAIFSLYMPKNTNCFIYMNLQMDPGNLDVNIHPTKHEVRFLYQDEIIAKIHQCFEQKLLNSNVSRSYYVQSLTLDPYVQQDLNASINKDNNATTKKKDDESSLTPTTTPTPVIYPYQLTRVDSKERKLDSFLHPTSLNESIRSFKENCATLNEEKKKKQLNSSRENNENNSTDEEITDKVAALKSHLRYQKLPREFNFVSLIELRDAIEKVASKTVKEILTDMNFVGTLDRELALIQHKTGLYISNTRSLTEELFYQISLFNFGNFGYFKLEEPISISELALMALDDPINEWEESYGAKDKLARRCAKLLYTKASMLDDYFSIKISKCGPDEQISLIGLPMLIEDYEPDLVDLPSFVVRLATEVEYDDEKVCFDSICKELGYFYSVKNPKYTSKANQEDTSVTKPEENWLIEHVIYNALRNMLLASTENQDTIFFKLVDLSKLYKVFERC